MRDFLTASSLAATAPEVARTLHGLRASGAVLPLPEPSPCAFCGVQAQEAVPLRLVVSDNFTAGDQLIPGSGAACPACAACARTRRLRRDESPLTRGRVFTPGRIVRITSWRRLYRTLLQPPEPPFIVQIKATRNLQAWVGEYMHLVPPQWSRTAYNVLLIHGNRTISVTRVDTRELEATVRDLRRVIARSPKAASSGALLAALKGSEKAAQPLLDAGIDGQRINELGEAALTPFMSLCMTLAHALEGARRAQRRRTP
jgi:CRISPR type IV-associated protein Csf1